MFDLCEVDGDDLIIDEKNSNTKEHTVKFEDFLSKTCVRVVAF